MKQHLFTLALLLAGFIVSAETIPIEKQSDLKSWKMNIKGVSADGKALKVSPTADDLKKVSGTLGLHKELYLKKYAGRTVEFSVEQKVENVVVFRKVSYLGTKFMIHYGNNYPGAPSLSGTAPWKKVSFRTQIPENGYLVLSLGLQEAKGTVYFRNLSYQEYIQPTSWKIPVEKQSDLKGWNFNGKGASADGTMLKITPTDEDAKTVRGLLGIWRGFNYRNLAGKKVMISAEMKYDKISLFGTQNCGTKFMVVSEGKYYGAREQIGTGDWRKVSFTFPVDKNGHFKLFLGMQGARGTICFRNFELRELETFVDLKKSANMGYADQVEKDGKGGWSDQGSENDGSKFNFRKGVYANVPFQTIDPAKNSGKSILSFGSLNFPKGIREAKLDGGNASSNYIYLLHTACWAGKTGNAGIITLQGEKGSQKIEVKLGKDIADQWNPVQKANALVGDFWNNGSGTMNGVYVSCFPVDQKIGKIRSITLSKGNTECCWIVIGITLSNKRYPLPVKKNFVVTEGDRFRPVAGCSPLVRPGSALDLSYLNTGKIERLIINKDGRLAKESKPDEPLRIFAVQGGMQLNDHYAAQEDRKRKLTIAGDWKTKADVKASVEELVRHGVNMLRIHWFKYVVVKDDGTVTFDKDALDFFDYGVYLCKQNGIYIQIDTMHTTGFTGLSEYSRAGQAVNAKYRLLFDEKMREQYRIGMKAFLNRINPYTKTALRDDPVLGYINYNNEQEFAFIISPYGPEGLAEWRKFIGDPNAPMFTPKEWRSKTEKGKKINEFIKMKWRFMLDWYRKLFRDEIGCKAVCGLLEMTGSMTYDVLRNDLDAVMMHAYHGHTSEECTAQSQGSDIMSGMKQARILMDGRIAGRPFMVNEYASVYWGRCRYEEGYAVGAYAAFQGFDMLVRHGSPIHTKTPERLFPWLMGGDPITRASLRTTAFLYARKDVQEAKRGIRLSFSEKGVSDNMIWMEAVNGTQSRLSLLAKFGLEQSDPAKHLKKPADLYKDLRIPLKGGSIVVENAQGTAGFATTIEKKNANDATLSDYVTLMKKEGILAKNNRSDGANIFESSTGELYANLPEMYMTVNTARFQGMCGKEGAKASLKDVKLELIRTPGALSVVSLDPEKSLKETKKILFIYSTNALSNKMRFEDESMRKVRYYGEAPVMIETGHFRIELATDKPFTVYPLLNDGTRCAAIPATFRNGKQIIDVDTLKLPGGPSIYFELVK